MEESTGSDKLRRYIRILAHLGRIAVQNVSIDRILDQAAVWVARRMQVDHTKLLRYPRKKADLIMVAGTGWGGEVVRPETFLLNLRSPLGRTHQSAEPVVIEKTAQASDFVIATMLTERGIVSCGLRVNDSG